jgi:hypothetical protein
VQKDFDGLNQPYSPDFKAVIEAEHTGLMTGPRKAAPLSGDGRITIADPE